MERIDSEIAAARYTDNRRLGGDFCTQKRKIADRREAEDRNRRFANSERLAVLRGMVASEIFLMSFVVR